MFLAALCFSPPPPLLMRLLPLPLLMMTMLLLLEQDERYHPPPAVLPREGVVVVALGPFKALLHTDACLLFEAGKLDVSHIAPMLADLVKANNEVSLSNESRVELSCFVSEAEN